MSIKEKVSWVCQECGQKQAKWVGKCPACSLWNTFQEEKEIERDRRFLSEIKGSLKTRQKPIPIQDIPIDSKPRFKTGLQELDRVLGGGVVPGSLTLIGGDPGIGKSTLMLQLSNCLSLQGLTVLYISGEESLEQTSLRAKRLGVGNQNLLLYNETNFSEIKETVLEINPQILIIDSIQIMYKEEISSSPGSVTQVREIATEFMHLSKGHTIATFLIGHVTKSGEIAGPRVLEHLVDTVLYFEGDRHNHCRLIRTVKNRFGPTDEVAVFQMKEEGLKEVSNPSHIFLEERVGSIPGSAIIPTLEGSRSFLIEVQALVTQTFFSSPLRRASGIDTNRLSLLLAVLEKRGKFPMYNQDVFVSVAGGLKVNEPGVDLGILLALASSFTKKVIPSDMAIIGEVGLGGEIRSILRLESRIKEASLMGFTRILIPKKNLKNLGATSKNGVELIGVDTIDTALNILFQL